MEMSFFDRMRIRFYKGRLQSINKNFIKLREETDLLKQKILKVLNKYSSFKEIKCSKCKNEYYLEQVECNNVKNSIVWHCPNCNTRNFFKY